MNALDCLLHEFHCLLGAGSQTLTWIKYGLVEPARSDVSKWRERNSNFLVLSLRFLLLREPLTQDHVLRSDRNNATIFQSATTFRTTYSHRPSLMPLVPPQTPIESAEAVDRHLLLFHANHGSDLQAFLGRLQVCTIALLKLLFVSVCVFM